MTDLDQTEIISADQSLTEPNSIKASLQVLSGIEPTSFQINNDVVIGRSSPADIILFAPSLSKQHAKISFTNGQCFLTDLESSNKTFHNKIPIQPNVCYALNFGDEIKFGDVVCSFQQENGPSESSSSTADIVKPAEIEEQMDTEQTNESPSMVIDEKPAEENTEMDEETAPIPADAEPTAMDAEEPTVASSGRGVARKNVPRARGRRAAAAARPHVLSTRIHGTRRQAAPVAKVEQPDTTLDETVTTETEESPKKAQKEKTTPESNVRVSARLKERASSGRNRSFPYTDEYVDLDVLDKQPKPTRASPKKPTSSLRQQPIGATETKPADIYDDIDAPVDAKQTPRTSSRKRKTTPEPVKRSRPITPQTVPKANSRRKPAAVIEQSPPVVKAKRGPKPAKEETADRPVRIALSSHLNFDGNHLEVLRELGFEILDESSPVDALVVDRIRRTKKFFICLARGAHILAPQWVETMIKEKQYVPFEKFYLEDKPAETRYGFQLRESVRLAKQRPIFGNQVFFCTKDTSPPYDDLKDIIEAAGGKLIEKINPKKLDKDLICIVAQAHKNEYEELFKKGLAIVSEEFILSGISKQKLDFDTFSLFQVKANNEK